MKLQIFLEKLRRGPKMLSDEMRAKIKQRAYKIRKKKKARKYVLDCENGINQGTYDDPDDYDDTRDIPGCCW